MADHNELLHFYTAQDWCIYERLHPPIAMTIVEMGMTPCQRKVVRLLMQGYGSTEIANELGISTATVKCHLTKLYTKCGLEGDSRIKLAVLLHKLGYE